MPGEPPRDNEEEEFLDFLRDDGSSKDEEEEPAAPPAGEQGDLVVLQPDAKPGKGQDEFREKKAPPPAEKAAAGEKFREKPPAQSPAHEEDAEGGDDEFLGWLDNAAKDSLEKGPAIEDLMTQEMEEAEAEVAEPAEALLDDGTPETAKGAASKKPATPQAPVAKDEEIEAEADLIFGDEAKMMSPGQASDLMRTEAIPIPGEEKVEKQTFEDIRQMAAQDQPAEPEAMAQAAGEARAEFDQFLAEGEAASEGKADAPPPPKKQPTRTTTSRPSFFVMPDGTQVPALPPGLGGYKPPDEPEFGVRQITYPEIRTPAPVGLIILVIIIIGAIGALFVYRGDIQRYTADLIRQFTAPGTRIPGETVSGVTPVHPETAPATVITPPQTGTGTAATGGFDISKLVYSKVLNGSTYTFVQSDREAVEDFIAQIEATHALGAGRER